MSFKEKTLPNADHTMVTSLAPALILQWRMSGIGRKGYNGEKGEFEINLSRGTPIINKILSAEQVKN